MITIERPVDADEATAQRVADVEKTFVVPGQMNGAQARVRTRWPWIVAALAYVQYTLVSLWLLYVRHYSIGDALSRTATAKIMVLSRDPHLGSMGYYWLPLPTLARIPFVLLLQPFGRAELAGPLTSSFFAVATVVVLAGIGRRLGLSVGVTAAAVGIFAMNPLTIYIAANGMSETTLGFFLALSMYGFLRWRHDGTTVSLCITGLALGGAMASRFEALVITPAICCFIMIAAERGRRLQSAFVAVLPPAIVFALWSLASYLIMGDWLFWKTLVDELITTPIDAAWLPKDRSLVRLALHGGYLVLGLAPAVALVIAGVFRFPRRWRTSIAVVGMILLLPAVVTWQGYQGTSWDEPRFYMLTPMMATVGVLWLIRSARGHVAWSRGFTIVGVGMLGLSGVTGTLLLSNLKLTAVGGESVFFGALLGRSEAETSITPAEGQIGYLGTVPLFKLLERDLEPSFDAGKTVALDSIVAVPVLVSSHPRNYIIPEDREFEQIVADPIGRVDFILRINARATGYGDLLEKIIGVADGGNWVHVATYGGGFVKLYEWVPTGDQPTFVPSACCVP
jgi:4-amino-4-deoxy-L-arabinose transferase-like glycosyltransferase